MLEQLRISKKTLIISLLVALIVGAVAIRLPFMAYQSGDYKEFLLPWYNHLAEYGFSAFKESFANYNFPYLYLLWIIAELRLPPLESIKVLSFLFELVMAVAVYYILRHYRPKGWLPTFGAVLMLYVPTIVMNSSIWAQCDSMYAALILFSFYAALKDKRVAMWLLWGTAVSFKLQSMLFLPFLLYLWLTSKQSRLYDPFIALLPFILLSLPVLFVGQPLDSVLAVYVSQASYYPYLSANAPSLYGLFADGPTAFIAVGRITAALAVGALVLAAIVYLKKDSGKRYLLVLATLAVGVTTFLLPQMHERYFYLTEVFCVMLALLSLKTLWIATCVVFASSIMYIVVQFYGTAVFPPTILPFMSILMGVALLGLGYYTARYFTSISLKDHFLRS